MSVPKQLAGFTVWDEPDPFAARAGPFYCKDGVAAFICEPHHLNGNGVLHGGILMSLAGYAVFVVSEAVRDVPCVTLSCTSEFLRGAAPIGQPVYADGEVTRASRHLIFVRGRVFTDDEPKIAAFSGILKRRP